MKTLKEKRNAVNEIKQMLTRHGRKEVYNSGFLFYVSYSADVLRDTVVALREKYEIPVEMLDFEVAYFAGSEEKANALQEAFGGWAEKSEFEGIYTWKGLGREKIGTADCPSCLVNLEEAKEILSLV